MSRTTAAGSQLAVCAGRPSAETAAAYGALAWTRVGGVATIGTIDPSPGKKIEFQPFIGPPLKFKGRGDRGALQPSIGVDDADAGQALLRAASADFSGALYSVRVMRAGGALRYFGAFVLGMPETIDGAATVVTVGPVIEICTDIVRVNAPDVAPDPTPTLDNTFANSTLSAALFRQELQAIADAINARGN